MKAKNPDEPYVSRGQRLWWWGKWILLIVAVKTVGLLVYRAYFVYKAEERVKAAIAEADRLDPGWRFEELVARRAQERIPDAENGALHVMATAKLLPRPHEDWRPQSGPAWPTRSRPLDRPMPPVDSDDLELEAPELVIRLMGKPEDEFQRPADALDQELQNTSPNELWGRGQAHDVATELEDVSAALLQARQVARFTRGRFEVQWSPDYMSTLLPHMGNARAVASLLCYDAMHRAQRGEIDEALTSCHTSLVCGRVTLGNDPISLNPIMRAAIASRATLALEHVVAQGQPAESALNGLQGLLMQEASEPVLLLGLRGDRAGFHEVFERVCSFELKNQKHLAGTESNPLWRWCWVHPLYRYSQGPTLEFMNRAVEIAKLPIEQQPAAYSEWDRDIKALFAADDKLIMMKVFVAAVDKIAAAYHRGVARLRCAIVALAAERYRLAHAGHWPQSLDELAGLVPMELTLDPFDGQPLRFLRVDDGLIIYSIGADGRDDGGFLNRSTKDEPGTDLGFQLWDVPHRRRPPANDPPMPPAEPEP